MPGSTARNSVTPEIQDQLIELAAACAKDPLRYVLLAYPWGEKGTFLEKHPGPDEWQRDILAYVRDNLGTGRPLRLAVAGGVGPGKALAHGEPVLTPTGWCPIESLAVGDLVIAGDGAPTAIVGVWPQGMRDLFRVTLSDGSSVVADGDHQWLTWSLLERKRDRPPSVRTTAQIAASIIGRESNGQLNHRIPTCGVVDHPRAVVPVEPYLLGFWLGDGGSAGRIGVSLPDKVAAVAANVSSERHVSSDRPDYYTWQAIPRPTLRLLNLEGCRSAAKFIPRVYLHANIEQRIALLQGLLDTDGTVEAKSAAITYDTMSAQLADDVAELVRSLGGVARRGTKRATLNGVDYGTAYRVYVSLPQGIFPFRTPAKAARYKPQWGHRNCERTRRRYIASVEPVGCGLATCISVAHPSQLFVTRDHIVTHNSALAAWLADWGLTTCTDCRIRVTANTGPQISTATWPEITKWQRASLWSHWFDRGDRRIRSVEPSRKDSWRCDAITWDEHQPEAFAGFHNAGRRIVYLFDESAGIAESIFKESEGILSGAEDTEVIWLCLGNPTRTNSTFRTFFAGGKNAHLWKTWHIDTRTARMSDKAQIEEWITSYGLDSDFVRVRVLSQFPRAGSTQFISTEDVSGAMSLERDAMVTLYDPLIMGVDVARYGDDKSVIRFRRGRDARSIKPMKFRNMDTMQLAARVAECFERYQPDAIFIDQGGVGAGVVDRCNYLKLPVIGIDFGSDPSRDVQTLNSGVWYYNKRAEMWGRMKDWLPGGMLDDDPELAADLPAVEYGYAAKGGRDCIVLEKKEHMKKRGLASPDDGDALALTFAHPVAPADQAHKFGPRGAQTHQFDYDPLAIR